MSRADPKRRERHHVIGASNLEKINKHYTNFTAGDLIRIPSNKIDFLEWNDAFSGPTKGKETMIEEHIENSGVFMLLARPSAKISPIKPATTVEVPVLCFDFKTVLKFDISQFDGGKYEDFFDLIQMVKPSSNSPLPYPPVVK